MFKKLLIIIAMTAIAALSSQAQLNTIDLRGNDLTSYARIPSRENTVRVYSSAAFFRNENGDEISGQQYPPVLWTYNTWTEYIHHYSQPENAVSVSTPDALPHNYSAGTYGVLFYDYSVTQTENGHLVEPKIYMIVYTGRALTFDWNYVKHPWFYPVAFDDINPIFESDNMLPVHWLQFMLRTLSYIETHDNLEYLKDGQIWPMAFNIINTIQLMIDNGRATMGLERVIEAPDDWEANVAIVGGTKVIHEYQVYVSRFDIPADRNIHEPALTKHLWRSINIKPFPFPEVSNHSNRTIRTDLSAVGLRLREFYMDFTNHELQFLPDDINADSLKSMRRGDYVTMTSHTDNRFRWIGTVTHPAQVYPSYANGNLVLRMQTISKEHSVYDRGSVKLAWNPTPVPPVIPEPAPDDNDDGIPDDQD